MTVAFEQLRALAMAQLACIEHDDIEGYLAGADAFEASLAATGNGLLGQQLEELIRIDIATRDRLTGEQADVARQLGELNGNRRANAAYLATSPITSGAARSA